MLSLDKCPAFLLPTVWSLEMQYNFKKSIVATFIVVFYAFNASEASATDNSSTPSKVDVTTICYNAGMVCQDACDKAALTVTEYQKCQNGCASSLSACLGGAASQGGATTQGGAATSIEQARTKRKKKNYVPPN